MRSSLRGPPNRTHPSCKIVGQVGKVDRLPFFVGFLAGFEFNQVGQVRLGYLVGCGRVFEAHRCHGFVFMDGGEEFETRRHRGSQREDEEATRRMAFIAPKSSVLTMDDQRINLSLLLCVPRASVFQCFQFLPLCRSHTHVKSDQKVRATSPDFDHSS